MIRILMLVILTVVARPPATSQTGGLGAEQSGKRYTGAEREVARVDQELTRAIARNDTQAMGRILSDDLILTASGGAVVGKARWIEIVESGTRRYKTYDTSDIRVQAYGGAAVVTGHASVTELAGGGEHPGQYRFTRVYVRRQGRWRVVAIQLTRVSQP